MAVLLVSLKSSWDTIVTRCNCFGRQLIRFFLSDLLSDWLFGIFSHLLSSISASNELHLLYVLSVNTVHRMEMLFWTGTILIQWKCPWRLSNSRIRLEVYLLVHWALNSATTSFIAMIISTFNTAKAYPVIWVKLSPWFSAGDVWDSWMAKY